MGLQFYVLTKMSRQSKCVNTSKPAVFSLRLKILLEFPLECTYLNKVNPHTTISTLKTVIEQDVGLLQDMYTVTYLDACPLLDDTTLQDNFMVSGSTITLRPWKLWQELLYYSYTGKHEHCLKTMPVTSSTSWNDYCAWVALYIASHHGHYQLVICLLNETQVAVNATSPCGWTALHAAARAGQWKVLCILIDEGADVRLKDTKGYTAFDLARKYGNKKCENSLNFCQWNLQKHYIIKERRKEYDANKARKTAQRQSHLSYDSSLTTWLHGQHGQIYMAHIPNSVTVKEVQEHDTDVEKKLELSLPSSSKEDTDDSDEGQSFDFNYGWFDTIRAQKLIPCTHDIITYADPSSCSLRPRSLLNPEGYTSSLCLPKTSKGSSK